MASVQITLCGRLGVSWDGQALEGELPGRQGRLLFAYLVLHRERPVRRDELLEVLWSEEGPPPSGDSLLAPPLSRLRKALGDGRLEGRGELALALPEEAWIDWEAVRKDLAAAREALDREDWEAVMTTAGRALEVADRGLLPGLEAPWIDELRAELAEARVEALEAVALAGVRIGGAGLRAAERAARAAVEAAPFRESAHQALIEALRERGNFAEALRAYEDLRTLLREELGSSPGPAVTALYEELLHASEPVAPGDPAPARLAQAAEQPLVGREAELAVLLDELGRTMAGETRLALVSGEAGIGKSRLVAELAARADGAEVLFGRCDEDQLFPFAPWAELLSGPLQADTEELLAGRAAEAARLVPELGVEPAGREPDQQQLLVAIATVLERLAGRRPLVVVIDDLHWADPSTLAAARHVLRSPALGPVLVVATIRDDEPAPGHPLTDLLGDLEREREPSRVRLTGLSRDDVAALVGGGADADAIHRETEGNPFFARQLAAHADQEGVPAGVRDVILRRVARLPEGAHAVLSAAGLVGRDFELEVVERVVDLDEDTVLDVLDAGVSAALLTEVPGAPGRFSFAHALVRTTLEEELTATRRARLHRSIGEAIESAHAGNLEPHLSELARHFAASGAGEADRTVSYAERAAAQAAGRLAFEEASVLLATAVAAREADEPVDQADLARLLSLQGHALWRTGRHDEPRQAFLRAAEAARESGSATLLARAAVGHAGGPWERFGVEDPEGRALLEEALTAMPEGDSPARAQLMARLGAMMSQDRATDGSERELLGEAVSMARRVDDLEALVTASAAAEHARWMPGEAEARLETAAEVTEGAERLGDQHLLAEAVAWRGIALLELCRREEADADLARYLELAERLDHPVMAVHRRSVHTMQALLQGCWDDAEAAAADLMETGNALMAEGLLPAPVHFPFHGAAMIALRGEQLRMPEVAAFFAQVIEHMGPDPGLQTPVAWGHAQAGEADKAHGVIDVLRAEDYAAVPRDVNFIPSLAVLAHAIGELEDAALAAELEPLLRPYAGTWVVFGPAAATLGPVDYSLGLLELTAGRPAAAESDFTRAVELCRRMGARPYLAHSMLGRATTLGDDEPEESARLREEAVAIGRELDMPRLLRDAERLSPAAP